MSLFKILETLLIGPLKLVFEIIFEFANRFIGHPGLSIIFLSLVMNILVLPLYKRADAMQEASRDVELKLSRGVSHIKKTFSGDERMMILQTYYRQNNYKPTDALHGSVSLLLEIPFFMAAYQFLSNLSILDGVSMGPIKDLGAPDGLIVIGAISINLLPILMTLINVISSALYLKGFPLKTKIQLYGMALFFLVFLYTSPSCLVFYWTLNNLFSLVKTIFYKIKNPQKVLRILTAIVGLAFLVLGVVYKEGSIKRNIFLLLIGFVLELPLLLPIIKAMLPAPKVRAEAEPNRKTFILGTVFLTVLMGLLIPSTYISASPQEYVDVSYFHNPLWYIVSSGALAAGTFLVWMGVFYWLASKKGKVFFEKLVMVLCGITFVNYMFFGTKLGTISSVLQYEKEMTFSILEQIVNIAVLLALSFAIYFCLKKWKKAVSTVFTIGVAALVGMSGLNVVTISSSVSEISAKAEESGEAPSFELSKKGKNVVVLMLDRAMGQYIPYIMNEKPELKEKFSGFTYYGNTISHGGFTNYGVPALYGGYEYTPVEMNKRDSESLVSKHNEAIKVLPKIFEDNGYDVTVCDPPYANYQWIPDLSIYDEFSNVDAYITKGKFSDVESKQNVINSNYRNFFCFSLMKSMPLLIQPTIYNNGAYNQIQSDKEEPVYAKQNATSPSNATGFSALFMDSYNVMTNMSNITKITDDEANTFLIMANDLTHEPALLQEPEYVPAETVDNTEFDAANTDRFTLNGVTLNVSTAYKMSHYQTNMAAAIQLGNWFDYLRENDVYDNTRIILVSDHGRLLSQIDELIMDNGEDPYKDAEMFYPLLMVKDFYAEGFNISNEFMTNADVPTLATSGLIENPTNPYTGKAINSNAKTEHEQYIILSDDVTVENNTSSTFVAARWASVKDNLWEKENWSYYEKPVVLKEHQFPEE